MNMKKYGIYSCTVYSLKDSNINTHIHFKDSVYPLSLYEGNESGIEFVLHLMWLRGNKIANQISKNA